MSDWELRKKLGELERLLWLIAADLKQLNARVARLEREVFGKTYPKTSGIVVKSR